MVLMERSVFVQQIVENMSNKPHDKGRMSDRADTAGFVLLILLPMVESLPSDIVCLSNVVIITDSYPNYMLAV